MIYCVNNTTAKSKRTVDLVSLTFRGRNGTDTDVEIHSKIGDKDNKYMIDVEAWIMNIQLLSRRIGESTYIQGIQ